MFFINTDRDNKPVNDATVNQSLDNYLINTLKLPGHADHVYQSAIGDYWCKPERICGS